MVAVATAGCALVVVLRHQGQPAVAGFLAMVVVGYGVASVIDLAEQRLPDRITLPLAAAATSVVVAGSISRSDPVAAIGPVAVGLAFSAVLLALRFGMGDVKLAVTVGTIAAWLGHQSVLATVLVGSLAGAVVAAVVLAVHRRRGVTFGYGPALAIGSVAGMVVAGP
jgi:leader peptidase (prepilin peptidase)/N-methyltransferase